MQPILALIGPTGTGKTHFVCRQAEYYPIEVVSMDSAMIYNELSIAANKPTADELKICPHHVINCRTVLDRYDVAQFFYMAKQAIADIIARKKIPIIVGGTMMYANVLKNGLSQSPSLPPEQKKDFLQYWSGQSSEKAYATLCALDQEVAKKLHHNDLQRILRAIEIAQIKSISNNKMEQHPRPKEAFAFPLKFIGLTVDSIDSHKILLEKRVDIMLRNGMQEEISDLYVRFGSLPLDFWRFVGYRQYQAYFSGQISLSEARSRTIIATHQLAKHQRTWMRSFKSEEYEVTTGNLANNKKIDSAISLYCQSFSI